MMDQAKLEKLKRSRDAARAQLEKTEDRITLLQEIASTGSDVIEDIDKQFEIATKLNKKDISFLFLAIALQCTRILFQPKLNLNFEKTPRNQRNDANKDGEKEKKARKEKAKENQKDNISSQKYPDIVSMFLYPVPYDAMIGTERILIPGVSAKGKCLYGGNHHSATLGHDPVLGYIFGTINIMTQTISFKNIGCQTCNVILSEKTLANPANYSGQSVGNIDYSFIEIVSMLKETISEDYKRVPAALGRHVLHLQSDKYCSDGLPFPFISPERAQKLIDDDWNSQELAKLGKLVAENISAVGMQAMISIIIKVIIEFLHKLTYREEMGIDRDVFAVKTHKILEISNIIASTSNVIAVLIGSVVGVYTGNGQMAIDSLENLDVGGLLVTIHRIATDENFINELKMEYLRKNWNNYVSTRIENAMVQEELI